jgi:hypothetical protein
LELKYRSVRMVPPDCKKKLYPAITVTVLHAKERSKPKGRAKINWRLSPIYPSHRAAPRSRSSTDVSLLRCGIEEVQEAPSVLTDAQTMSLDMPRHYRDSFWPLASGRLPAWCAKGWPVKNNCNKRSPPDARRSDACLHLSLCRELRNCESSLSIKSQLKPRP